MRLSIKGYILIAAIVFMAMSMMSNKGNDSHASALGAIWANEMATSNAMLDESAANCKDVLTKTSFGCGGIFR